MFKLVVASCVLAVVLAAPGGNHRIVNGFPITIQDAPYQVAVGSYDSGSGQIAIWCGGSIISSGHVVTASHCFNDHDINTEKFHVFVGMTYLNQISIEMLVPVRKAVLHENYDKVTHNFDIALLELDQALSFNEKVQPVGLPSRGQSLPIGQDAYGSGWGKLFEDGPSANQLQAVWLRLFSASECSRYSNFDSQNMVCAGSLDGSVDSCQGDSGGPLVLNNILWGITSYGNGCARPGFPGVYAHVSNLRDFIYKNSGI